MAVEPHGGHFWSTQGQVQRPMDITSLRIDNQVPLAQTRIMISARTRVLLLQELEDLAALSHDCTAVTQPPCFIAAGSWLFPLTCRCLDPYLYKQAAAPPATALRAADIKP